MSDQQPETTMETRDCPKCGFYKSHGLDAGTPCRRVGCDGAVEATTWTPVLAASGLPQLSEGELFERIVAGGAHLSIDGSDGYLFLRTTAGDVSSIASLNPDDTKWLAEVVDSKLKPGEEPSFEDWVSSLLPHRPEGTPWNDSGFSAFPDFETDYGHTLRVTESSMARDAFLWIRADRSEEVGIANGLTDSPEEHAAIHIQADQAAQFAVTILAAVWDHYQGKPSIGEDAEGGE